MEASVANASPVRPSRPKTCSTVDSTLDLASCELGSLNLSGAFDVPDELQVGLPAVDRSNPYSDYKPVQGGEPSMGWLDNGKTLDFETPPSSLSDEVSEHDKSVTDTRSTDTMMALSGDTDTDTPFGSQPNVFPRTLTRPPSFSFPEPAVATSEGDKVGQDATPRANLGPSRGAQLGGEKAVEQASLIANSRMPFAVGRRPAAGEALRGAWPATTTGAAVCGNTITTGVTGGPVATFPEGAGAQKSAIAAAAAAGFASGAAAAAAARWKETFKGWGRIESGQHVPISLVATGDPSCLRSGSLPSGFLSDVLGDLLPVPEDASFEPTTP